MFDLKQLITFILALLIFMQPFQKVWIYISFKINQDYIAKNLCENRAKPTMHCNGKCHLMKKLKEADKEEQNQLPQNFKEKSEIEYCHYFTNYLFGNNKSFEFQNESFFDYKFTYLSSYHTDIFHPPKFSLI